MDNEHEEQTFEGLRIRIYRTRCIGSGNCVNVAPEVFELGSDQIVTFRDDAHAVEPERMVEACRVCPVDALFAYDGDEQVVP
jgi:ferredoxin